MKEDAATIIRKKESLFSELDEWKGHWSRNAKFCAPQVDIYADQAQSPDETGFGGLFDTTAIEAVDSYASGIIGEVFPSNEKWMVWTPEDVDGSDDAAKAWYAKCGEIALMHLSRSRFYQQLKPVVVDLAYAGTGALSLRRGKRSNLQFSYVRLGNFAIEEDGEGTVTALYRQLDLTAEQMADMFGEEVLGEKVSKALQQGRNGRGSNAAKFKVIHAVFERRNPDQNSPASSEMPYASNYVCETDRIVLESSGYDYFPYAAMRAERWNDYVYGISPASKAMPAIRQLNVLYRNISLGLAKAVNPPIMMPSDQVGEAALYPAGITIYDSAKGHGQKPEILHVAGDYKGGIEAAGIYKEEVRRFFHADLFEAIAQKDKQMTAREVAAIEAGALRKFLPNFNQITSEMQDMFRTMFSILMQDGAFPPPPLSIIENGMIGLPKVEFTSRIALAMRLVDNNAIDRQVERLIILAPLQPDILDNIDMDELIKTAARNDGVPEDILRLDSKVKEMRKVRQEQEQAAMQAALAEQVANTAKTVGETDGANVEENAQRLQLAS